MKRLATLLWLLALAGPCCAQSVALPAEIKVAKPGLVTIVPTAVDADSVRWVAMDDGLQLIPSSLLKNDLTAVGVTLQPGSYRVRAIAARCVMGKAVMSEPVECLVTVGGTPVPPGPPTPPGPNPPAPPAPIPAAGLHVLVVYETADLTKMPAAQQTILYSQTVRDYLNAKCPVGADGKTKEWRVWDKDVAAGAEAQLWQDAMKRPRSAVPWVIVSDGKSGYEGPLPASVADMMTLLQKWGG